MAVDNDRLMEFLGRFVGDLGATTAAGNIVVGHRQQTRIATLGAAVRRDRTCRDGLNGAGSGYGRCDLGVGRLLCAVRGCTARGRIIRRSPGKP